MRPWAHLTFEASLNLLWALLAVAAFFHWAMPASGRRPVRLASLVSLVFALALLFPVISAADDLAEWGLINEATITQSVTTVVKSHKQAAGRTVQIGLPAIMPYRSDLVLSLAPASFSDLAPAANVTPPGGATGNHSPPLG